MVGEKFAAAGDGGAVWNHVVCIFHMYLYLSIYLYIYLSLSISISIYYIYIYIYTFIGPPGRPASQRWSGGPGSLVRDAKVKLYTPD